MAFFGIGKNKEKEKNQAACTCSCGCGCSVNETETTAAGNSADVKKDGACSIKVLGTGCKSCHEQYENVKQAVRDMGLSVEAEYVTDMQKIMEYGVMSMPAIVVNDKVVSAGRVRKAADVITLLRESGFDKTDK